uniref:Uncharacterized protein n=1 Tax=viral metagenome TaxID=1070528 RepID=A0A6M3KTT5_9ZZZZ
MEAITISTWMARWFRGLIMNIYIISVCDRDGYFIPVLAATTGEAAKSMLAKWRQQNEGNENWTELDDCTVAPLYCDIANQ